jgi:hypothetical protein
VRPSLPNAQSSTFSATNSDLRNAPANPSKISARSRTPIKPASVVSTIARISSANAAVFCVAAVPSVRRIPFSVLRTMAAWVGDSSPAALCASAIASNLRSMLPGFRCPTDSAIYAATVSALAGRVLAALISLASFYNNYRNTLRASRDGAFTDALKRFGESPNASSRASACGVLTQMAKTPRFKYPNVISLFGSFQNLFRFLTLIAEYYQAMGTERQLFVQRSMTRFIIFSQYPYLEVFLRELVAAMAVEHHPLVLRTVRDSLYQLVPLAPQYVLSDYQPVHVDIQTNLVYQIGQLLHGMNSSIEAGWNRIATLTGFDPMSLIELASNYQVRLQDGLDVAASMEYDSTDLGKQRKDISDALSLASRRLEFSVAVIARCLVTLRFGFEYGTVALSHIFLVRANLEGTFLRNIDFRNSIMTGANLRQCKLDNIDLGNANLEDANLDDAILNDVRLDGANLRGSKRSNITLTDGTSLSAAAAI